MISNFLLGLTLTVIMVLSSAGTAYAQTCERLFSPAKYQTVKMDWRYKGESRGLNPKIRFGRMVVKYLTDAEIDELEVIYDGKKWIYAQSGESVKTRWVDYYLVVMDENGRLFMGGDNHFIGLHHSSIPQGGPVASAGIVQFSDDGNVRNFINATGHYYRSFAKEPGLNFRNLSSEFGSRGVDVSKIADEPYVEPARVNSIERFIMMLTGG